MHSVHQSFLHKLRSNKSNRQICHIYPILVNETLYHLPCFVIFVASYFTILSNSVYDFSLLISVRFFPLGSAYELFYVCMFYV